MKSGTGTPQIQGNAWTHPRHVLAHGTKILKSIIKTHFGHIQDVFKSHLLDNALCTAKSPCSHFVQSPDQVTIIYISASSWTQFQKVDLQTVWVQTNWRIQSPCRWFSYRVFSSHEHTYENCHIGAHDIRVNQVFTS